MRGFDSSWVRFGVYVKVTSGSPKPAVVSSILTTSALELGKDGNMEDFSFFTPEELKVIVEALLFAGCADVCMDVSGEWYKKATDIAVSIHEKAKLDISESNVYVFGSDNYEDPEITEKIKKNTTIGVRV